MAISNCNVVIGIPNSAAIKKITAAKRLLVNSSNNWPKSALTLVNNELSDGPDKAAIALADEATFKGCNDAALAASMLAYEPALAFNCCINC